MDEGRPTLADLRMADDGARLVLETAEDQIPRLCTLLSRGGFIKVRTGCSLRELILEQFEVSADYLKNDIKVLFLNSSPVDDMDSAIVRDGAVLALSGAMPGVVGAAMRRDGLSWMRSGITHEEQAAVREQGEGVIYLKLFNVVMADLGASFLRRAIYLEPAALARSMENRFTDEFWRKCRRITFGGEVVGRRELLDRLSAGNGYVRLSIA